MHRDFIQIMTGLIRLPNTSTPNFQKTALTLETDYCAYKKLSDKNSGFKVKESSNPELTY